MPKDPLHGKTLEMIVTELVEHFGWEDLAASSTSAVFNTIRASNQV